MKHVRSLASSKQLFLSIVLIIIKQLPVTTVSRASLLYQRKRAIFHGFLTTEVWNYDWENKSLSYSFWQFLVSISFFTASNPPLQNLPSHQQL
uniref:Uncharacterized protein n=1 Tax=Lepeophtheirus salmonis TaxID=72036 RepID=A0A0K2TV20_LEPSM